jgi:hypothetical protein
MDLNKLRAFLDSEEGQKSLEAFAQRENEKEKRYTKANQYIQSLKSKDFEDLLKKEIAKHDEAWRDRCWKAGYEPYPSNLLELLFSVAERFGKPVKQILDEFDREFGGGTFRYRGFYFNWIHGQGTVLRIFDSDKEEIFTT